MEILNFLKTKRKKQFISETDFTTNRGRQSYFAIETLGRLRELHIEEEDELKADYFFYAATIEKANNLSNKLKELNHLVQQEMSPEKKAFIIKGQTAPMKMTHEVLRNWALEMCDLGYQHDCDFSEWEITVSV